MPADVRHESLDSLADAIGIGRTTAFRWRNSGAPAPSDAGYSESEWRQWGKAHGRRMDDRTRRNAGDQRKAGSKPKGRPVLLPTNPEDPSLDDLPDDDPAGPLPDDPDGSMTVYRNARTRIARMELKKMRGELIPVAYVERMAEQIALTCLSVLLEAPASLAQQFPEIDGRTFRDRCQGVLDAGRRRVAENMLGILQSALGDPPGKSPNKDAADQEPDYAA
jgi:hypothetical protein